jgi:catechol 2,3-dioxygenase-like lactoylglutathione lyase family enzyme
MALKRMDNIGIVVEDLRAMVDFFRELGLQLEGQGMIEGSAQEVSPAWAIIATLP